jgi:hypothetical protein
LCYKKGVRVTENDECQRTGEDSQVKRCLFHVLKSIQLVQHIRLLIRIRGESNVDDDVLNNLYSIREGQTAHCTTYMELLLLVGLDLCRVPNLLVRATGFEESVVLQSELDHEIIVSQFDILTVSARFLTIADPTIGP